MSAIFDMSKTTKDLKSSVNYLKVGVHNVKFMGVTIATLEVKGLPQEVMNVLFEGEGGIYNHIVFAPRSTDRRETVIEGRTLVSPSEFEQFMCFCKHLIEATNKPLSDKIDAGEYNLSASTFNEFAKLMIAATKDSVGKELKIKLLPRDKYASFPSYPARINDKGDMYLATKFMGQELTLSAYEKTMIEQAQNATPTVMEEDKKADSNSVQQAIDDLPF